MQPKGINFVLLTILNETQNLSQEDICRNETEMSNSKKVTKAIN